MPKDKNRNRLPEGRLLGTRILITGGLGMLGSTIAHELVRYGCEVTLVDTCAEEYGANWFNVESIRDRVKINIADIRDREAMKVLVRDKDVIFNLAAQVSHNDSIKEPFLDADINYIGHLNVLESAKTYNPEARIVFSGSRLQFGQIHRIPVREDQPLNPITPYALNKAAAENMYKFYDRVHGLRCTVFRIANPYGIRCQMKHSKYSIINFFIRQALSGRDILIFGDGTQQRDYIYVEDLSRAMIAAAISEKAAGEVFNIGSGIGTKFVDMAKMVIRIVGRGRIRHVPWPKSYINVETGDYVTDISKITQTVKWQPSVGLEEGISRTVTYYKRFGKHYF